MSHSPLFNKLVHTIKTAYFCDKKGISTAEGIERISVSETHKYRTQFKRREFIGDIGKLALLGGTIDVTSGNFHETLAASPIDAKIAIVGAGLAGLACGYELQKQGIRPTLYEVNDTRAGGRCYSLDKFFPGQVAERGGEFIDNLHKTMLGYVKEFNLELEDLSKEPGEVFYYFDGQSYPESAVVDEYRDFVKAMGEDLRTVGQPTADSFTSGDKILDFTNLQDYLDSRRAGYLIKKAIEAAYVGEYGLEIEQQSCLNFLLFIHADRCSKFQPFGVFSNERYHVVGGNQQIVEALKSRLQGQIQYNKKLIAVSQDSSSKIELSFEDGSSEKFDATVLAIPFSSLRAIDLRGLELPRWKLDAINNLVYGTHSKLMVGFNSRPWINLGGNGTSYANLPFLQGTWETNPSRANQTRGVLTDYSGGNLGASIKPENLQKEATNFLKNLDLVFPGALDCAVRTNDNQFLAYLENWLLNPTTQGSYTCNQPGYFTTIAGNEGKSVDNLYFAGEHANSFYEWQGFMEGAVVSGVVAAKQILTRVRKFEKV